MRINEAAQQDHDREVCRLAQKYASFPIWSSCPNILNTVGLPKFPLNGIEYEPDVFLTQVVPKGEDQAPYDWIFEMETSDSISLDHTKNQLTAFAEYAKKLRTKILVLVPSQDIDEMKSNLTKWELGKIVTVEKWGWPVGR
ncbi:MAG: hypothetical protein ACLPY5_11610 [Candidatus Bathyarchaeia archaeon]